MQPIQTKMLKKKDQDQIKKAFDKVKIEMGDLKERIAVIETQSQKSLTQPVSSSASLVQVGANSVQKQVQKKEIALPMKLKKGYQKKQILEEMQNLIKQGYSVTEIEQIIIDKFGISRRTFYNYKKRLIIKVQV